MPGPALRAEVVAQARHYDRAVPGTGTISLGPGRARAVLYSAMPMPAQQAWPIWPSIQQEQGRWPPPTSSYLCR
jgi:hypothetical protein